MTYSGGSYIADQPVFSDISQQDSQNDVLLPHVLL